MNININKITTEVLEIIKECREKILEIYYYV